MINFKSFVNESKKASKKEAGYKDSSDNDEKCINCTMWRDPNKCSAVSGNISPNGWCEWFAGGSYGKRGRLAESNDGFKGVVYHGTDARFDKFDQRKSRIVNDNYGGGVAYFTDGLSLAITYAKNMAKKSGNDPIVYSVELKLNKLFDVDHEFTGKELVDILPTDIKDFARGAGLLGLNADEYKMLSNLKTGNIKLTGEQVYRGLSKGNTQTSKARDHLISKGYDGLRYNMNTAPKHSVYLAYNANDIKITKRQVVKQK